MDQYINITNMRIGQPIPPSPHPPPRLRPQTHSHTRIHTHQQHPIPNTPYHHHHHYSDTTTIITTATATTTSTTTTPRHLAGSSIVSTAFPDNSIQPCPRLRITFDSSSPTISSNKASAYFSISPPPFMCPSEAHLVISLRCLPSLDIPTSGQACDQILKSE